MMKIMIFPEGYDPVIAAGPPSEFFDERDFERMEEGLDPVVTWTEEDTLHHQKLEAQSRIVEVERPPKDAWYMQVNT